MEDWLDRIDPEPIVKTDKVKAVANAFSGLESAMNLPTGSTPIPKGLAKTVKKNTEIAIQGAKEVLADPEESFEDKEFIRETIKIQIIKMQSIMDIMEGSIMVGAEPRMFEVYSDLNKSILDACFKLMQLQKQSENSQMMKTPPNTSEIVMTETKSIKTKGSDMASFLDQLRGGGSNQPQITAQT